MQATARMASVVSSVRPFRRLLIRSVPHEPMGLYRIPVKQSGVPLIPDAMRELGLPVTRTEQDAQGVHYFFAHPKRNIELQFWLTAGTPSFLMIGVGGVSKRILAAFGEAGILERTSAEPGAPPSGGPAKPFDNSDTGGGPPSVS